MVLHAPKNDASVLHTSSSSISTGKGSADPMRSFSLTVDTGQYATDTDKWHLLQVGEICCASKL